VSESDAVDAAYAKLDGEEKKASHDAELELNKLFHTTITEVATGAIERTRDGAKFVQTAATAIFAVDTGLLGLVFSVTDHPLPLRGAYAGVFLGLSIAFATAYLAFLGRPKEELEYTPDLSSEDQMQLSRTAFLAHWVNETVGAKRYATRASVLALLFGVLLIAAPFVSSATPTKAPEPVAAPAAPTAVPKGFEGPALDVYRAQVKDYRAAVAARSTALEAEQTAAATRRTQEHRLDRVFGWLAGIALLVVLLGPFVPERWPVVWRFVRGPQTDV
jgi:hypothetical protein